MKPDYDKLIELMQGYGYNVVDTRQKEEFFMVTLTMVYFTGSDFYCVRKYAEECGVYFDGFFAELGEKCLSVELQFLESKPEGVV